MKLALSELATRSINVVAHVKSNAGSVRFGLGDARSYRTENSAPFALAGDTNGKFNAWKLTPGRHVITATAYGDGGADGAMGNAATLALIVRE